MIDNDFNKTQYEEHAQTYTSSNNDGRIGGGTPKERTQLLLKYLPKGRHIFEVGTAAGKDALALQQAGYEVTASDFVEPFVEGLKKKGLHTVLFDAKKDVFPTMDALYANAVFVHFTAEELRDCLMRAKERLQNEKIVFMSVLKGEGQERSGRTRGIERDFQYYTIESLSYIVKTSGFTVVHSEEVDEKWIWVIATSKNEMDVDVVAKDMWRAFKKRTLLGKAIWILFICGCLYVIFTGSKFDYFSYLLVALPITFLLDSFVGKK